jgi:hypothetical protein
VTVNTSLTPTVADKHKSMSLRRINFLILTLLCFSPLQYAQSETLELPERNMPVSIAEIEAICQHYELTALWSLIEKNPPALPFRSDGCSVWPDKWLAGRDLYEGCFIHDLHYWAGIPGDEMGRLGADVWLLMWVGENVSIELAETMFNGVRVGGREAFDTPWRWGFGRSGIE